MHPWPEALRRTSWDSQLRSKSALTHIFLFPHSIAMRTPNVLVCLLFISILNITTGEPIFLIHSQTLSFTLSQWNSGWWRHIQWQKIPSGKVTELCNRRGLCRFIISVGSTFETRDVHRWTMFNQPHASRRRRMTISIDVSANENDQWKYQNS